MSVPIKAPIEAVVGDFRERTGSGLSGLSEDKQQEKISFFLKSAPVADVTVNEANSITDMHLIATDVTVKMLGKHTRISNNRIEVTDGRAGLYLRGEAPVIENNIFIFKGMARTVTAAPVKLFQASGAVLRNNVFIIEDARWAPEHAVSIIDSPNVTLEGNRVFGGQDLVRVFGEGSSVAELGTTLQPYDQRPALAEEVRSASDIDYSMQYMEKYPFSKEQEQFNY